MRSRYAVPFAIGVGVVWAIVTIVSLFTNNFQAAALTAPMGLLAAGFLFDIRRNGRDL